MLCCIEQSTGTFIGILQCIYNIIHQQQQSQNEQQSSCISICDTVLQMRSSREGMVQSKSQYKFIFTYLIYAVQNKLYGIQ